MEDPIELRNWQISTRNDSIMCKKGDSRIRIPFMDTESCVWTNVLALDRSVLRLGIILTFALGIGLIVLAIYYYLKVRALDVMTKEKEYVIVGKSEKLQEIKDKIDEYRGKHGRAEDLKADKLLDSGDERIYDIVDEAMDEREGTLYGDIKACMRCGCPRVGPASVSEGGVPGVFELEGQYVCKNCGYVGTPLVFTNVKEYEEYVESLKNKESSD